VREYSDVRRYLRQLTGADVGRGGTLPVGKPGVIVVVPARHVEKVRRRVGKSRKRMGLVLCID